MDDWKTIVSFSDGPFSGAFAVSFRVRKLHMGVSKNNGTLKSSILIGFSVINHPFWGTPIFGNTHILNFPHWCLVFFVSLWKGPWESPPGRRRT